MLFLLTSDKVIVWYISSFAIKSRLTAYIRLLQIGVIWKCTTDKASILQFTEA